ncbi:pitrilysin family protein [Sutterella sp.]|uniref:M16 family metallopeptidase n=1 Tax=Sutterella sp. TaxID=1981025 RepID=UPI0026DF09C9|nr:M16 family metallopeptidase [Sutterella sp.]MDO5532815.1 insulinase family protein [Sutterella sp.]
MSRFPSHSETRLTGVALSLLLALGGAQAAEFSWYDGAWPQEKTSVAPDPSVRFGRLANGLRFAIIPNKNPKGRVSLRLDVQTGSLMEEPHELGTAHYLEHMAFNGSRNFPAGSLIPFFQRHGMSFGGDTNAHTSFGETVYKLNLADTADGVIHDGLRILRDIADGLLLEPAEIDEERGVILSEKRARNTEEAEASRIWRSFVWGGTRFANEIIGTDETLKAMNAESVRAFYGKWYVPGRMVVVVAGDVDPARMEKFIRATFGSMPAAALPGVESFGEADLTEGLRVLVQKRPVSSTTITLMQIAPAVPVVDTEARQRRLMLEWIGSIALNRRLAARRDNEPQIWTRAIFHDARLQPFAPSARFMAVTTGANWRRALDILEEERRRAAVFGLTADEVKSIKDEIEATLERAVNQRSSWTNEYCADNFVSLLNQGLVYTSAEQDLERWRAMKDSITVEEASAELRAAFAPGNIRLRVSGDTDASEEEVRAVFEASNTAEVLPPAEAALMKFPYLDEPPAVPIPELAESAVGMTDLGLTKYEAVLENGLRLILLPLPFEKGTVKASLIFGDGTMGVPDEESLTLRTALSVLRQQGIGRLTALETSRRFAARGLVTSETAAETFNEISGSAQRDDLEMLLEAIRTRFLDPVVTEKNLEKTLQSLRQTEFSRRKTVEGVVRTDRTRFLLGGPLRLRSWEAADAEGVPLEAMRKYLAETRMRGARTLLITGDFDRVLAAAEAARLMGALPRAEAPRAFAGRLPDFPEDESRDRIVMEDRLGKSVLSVAWHLDNPDAADRRTAMTRRLVAAVVADRMRKEIREKLAAAYSPSAWYREWTEMEGFAYLLMQVETKRAQTGEVRDAMEAIARDLRDQGVTDEELELVKEPMRTAWRTNRRTNRFWSGVMRSEAATGRPFTSWAEQTDELLSAITASDVSREAKRIFSSPQAAFVVRSGGDDEAGKAMEISREGIKEGTSDRE